MALEDVVPAAVVNEQQPDPVKNWAEDEVLRERVTKEIIPWCRQVRDARAPLEDLWQQFMRTWTMEHDDQGYVGRSNIYLPAANKVVETLVSQLVAATFPGDEFFTAEAEKSAWQEMSLDVKALEMQRVRNAKVRSHAEAFYRQLLIKGNSPARVHWAEQEKKGKLRQKKRGSDPVASLLNGGEEYTFKTFCGPMFTPLPAEDVYYWPENCSSLEQALLVFETVSTTKKQLLYQAKKNGTYLASEVERLSENDRDDSKDVNDVERLAGQGYGGSSTDVKTVGVVDVVHAYCDFALSKDEDSLEMVPVCITFTWSGKVLRIIEVDNVCPGRVHPYVLGRMGTLVGRIHGTGVVERIHPLQLLLNDQMNQAMDCATYALNPIVLSNPDLLQGTAPDLEPGVQILVRDVGMAMKFDRPPVDLIQSSAILLTQTMAWMQDFGGAPPVLQGGSTPGRAFKTATGVGTAQTNATTPLTQMVRLCEADVWEPMLSAFWLLDQRFASQEVLLESGGTTLVDQRYMKPGELYGNYKFRWLASTQAANQQVMAGQIQQLVQLLANPGVMQALAQGPTPKRVNLAPLIERLIRTFGLRDAERILVDGVSQPTDAVPGLDAPDQQPQQQPMLEQLAGAQGQDPSGEFGSMRMGANQMAGALGALGGMVPQGEHMQLPGGQPMPGDINDLLQPF